MDAHRHTDVDTDTHTDLICISAAMEARCFIEHLYQH